MEVITTFADSQYEEYGKNFIRSFCDFWPSDIPLFVYCDTPFIHERGRIAIRDYSTHCPNQLEFAKRNKHIKQDDFYKAATRFSYKAFVIINHLRISSHRYVLWLDADVITVEKVTHEWLEKLLPTPKYVSALPRPGVWAETGFILFDREHPAHEIFLKEYSALYEDDKIFELKNGWTDSHAFSYVTETYLPDEVKSLSGPEKWHPFSTGILGEKLDHLKGGRKKQGYSAERLKYWK